MLVIFRPFIKPFDCRFYLFRNRRILLVEFREAKNKLLDGFEIDARKKRDN